MAHSTPDTADLTISYNITSPQGPRVHLPVTYFLFRDNLSFGAHAFRIPAPEIWKSLPLHIHKSQAYPSFRRHLKTHYFISAHLAP